MDKRSVTMAADGAVSDNRARRHQAERRLRVMTCQLGWRVDASIERQEFVLLD
jgi:hypothetical protein